MKRVYSPCFMICPALIEKGANHKVQYSMFNVQRLKEVVVVPMPNAFVRSPGAAPPTVMV